MPDPDPAGDDARSGRFEQRVLGPGREPDPRFSLANERTFLAWIRTALTLLGGGVAIEAFAGPVLSPVVVSPVVVSPVVPVSPVVLSPVVLSPPPSSKSSKLRGAIWSSS